MSFFCMFILFIDVLSGSSGTSYYNNELLTKKWRCKFLKPKILPVRLAKKSTSNSHVWVSARWRNSLNVNMIIYVELAQFKLNVVDWMFNISTELQTWDTSVFGHYSSFTYELCWTIKIFIFIKIIVLFDLCVDVCMCVYMCVDVCVDVCVYMCVDVSRLHYSIPSFCIYC